jgi:hypothetical protein
MDTGMSIGVLVLAKQAGFIMKNFTASSSETLEMLLEDGDPRLSSTFVGTQTVQVT